MFGVGRDGMGPILDGGSGEVEIEPAIGRNALLEFKWGPGWESAVVVVVVGIDNGSSIWGTTSRSGNKIVICGGWW